MKNSNGEASTIRKVLNTEVAQVITIAITIYVFLALIILPLQKNTQDIENIETNHIIHIQDSINQINLDLKANQKEHALILEMLGRIEGKLTR